MDILAILETVKHDWSILVVVFVLGGAWYQGKQWFKKITDSLEREGADHALQNQKLESILEKMERLEVRTDMIETSVGEIHKALHDQEVKLEVLDAVTTKRARR
jgi:uncharacterized protein (UPF0335 family)